MLAQIIGALITVLGIFATAVFAFLKWQRSLRFQILKDERDRLEKKFEICLNLYLKSLKDNSIDASMAAMFLFQFPEALYEEFEKAMNNKAFRHDMHVDAKQSAYYGMACEMSGHLALYENKIWQTCKLIEPRKVRQKAANISKNLFPFTPSVKHDTSV